MGHHLGSARLHLGLGLGGVKPYSGRGGEVLGNRRHERRQRGDAVHSELAIAQWSMSNTGGRHTWTQRGKGGVGMWWSAMAWARWWRR